MDSSTHIYNGNYNGPIRAKADWAEGSKILIEFKDVVKEYPNDTLATDHISLKIDQGEFVYVVGPSGAGKSTFIKMMYREEVPTSYSVTNDVKLTFKANEILFESLSQDNSEAKTQIEINLPLEEEIEIGINSRHVLDFLTQIDTADFIWGLNRSEEHTSELQSR